MTVDTFTLELVDSALERELNRPTIVGQMDNDFHLDMSPSEPDAPMNTIKNAMCYILEERMDTSFDDMKRLIMVQADVQEGDEDHYARITLGKISFAEDQLEHCLFLCEIEMLKARLESVIKYPHAFRDLRDMMSDALEKIDKDVV